MKTLLSFLSMLFATTTIAQSPGNLNLMPIPARVSQSDQRLVVGTKFSIAIKGDSDERLRAAVARLAERLAGRTGYDIEVKSDGASAGLTIERSAPGNRYPSLGEDESYTLEIRDSGAALKAATNIGALRGIETVLQLLSTGSDGYFLPGVVINDNPRFPWRGLLIDVGRHFEPVDVIKRNLDAMAAVKLNVFHWHLTEDQGFRIESRKFPRLHTMGSDGLYYTQDQVRDIVEYAAARGIRVVPEFDIPGHTTSWFVGHPELASGPGPYAIERTWGIMKPAMDPTNEDVYKLLDGFLGEMAALFPDQYLHIGGDEVEGHQWKENALIQQWMKAKNIPDNRALQAYFNRRVSEILTRHGKKMVGWDEILHPDLGRDIVVHSWRGPASLADAAKKGYAGILSNGYYIDHVLSAERHYLVDPIPANTDLSKEQQSKVLGGEATMWGEYVTPETIDSRIWPRTAAIAERLWSSREVNDVNDMYRRLQLISLQLEEHGLLHLKQQDAMLRRLARGENIGPLRTLASVVEPVKLLARYNWRKYTQQTPMTRFVDAARPDSFVARQFNRRVDELINNATAQKIEDNGLRNRLAGWQATVPALREVIHQSATLSELEPLALDLDTLTSIGIEALDFLTGTASPATEWRTQKLQTLDQIGRPKAEVEFAVTQGIRTLVLAASMKDALKTMTPADWKKQVIEAAVPKRPERR